MGGNRSEWEEVEHLGEGGQSKVSLVRRLARIKARQKSLQTIYSTLVQGMDRQRAEAVAVAFADISRRDYPSELGALKQFVPRPGLGQEAENSALGRLQNEIEALQKKRPGLVTLLDWNEKERWIVTEYCSNGTLEANLPRYKGNARASLAALLPIIRAVADLHGDGIIHRDIKPQNIFVAHDGRLLLGDLGLVFLPDQSERLSITGESVGPRDFMPPWVFLGPQPPKINQTFDVYMLGKVLWCMVSGNVKLHREDFLEPELDLTNMFPADPHMYAINMILKKSVVAREKACLTGAGDLWLMAVKISEIMERGAQLLNEGIPRPCHVCGEGMYQPEQAKPGSDHPTTSLGLKRIVSGQFGRSESENASGIKANLFCCDKCGHVQFFKVAQI